ncbi:hypothetical protein [Vibrio crassostreae]|uniref:hypothetical protein n=1 Tax=Vibrio crassostreae TaxID=246167 RepID=UPI001B30F992|nr:hypothetical protein [Vibrio crassostreae]
MNNKLFFSDTGLREGILYFNGLKMKIFTSTAKHIAKQYNLEFVQINKANGDELPLNPMSYTVAKISEVEELAEKVALSEVGNVNTLEALSKQLGTEWLLAFMPLKFA